MGGAVVRIERAARRSPGLSFLGYCDDFMRVDTPYACPSSPSQVHNNL